MVKTKPRRKPRPGYGGGDSTKSLAENLLYGINPVEAALNAGKRACHRLYLKTGKPSPKLTELQRLAGTHGVAVESTSTQDLETLCGSSSHQGVVLACGALPLQDESTALAIEKEAHPILVALDQVEDPRNFGAIVRTCAAFGAAGVVVTRHHKAPLSASASKASAGLLESYPLYEAANLARFLEKAKENGYWIAGTVVNGGQPLHQYRRDRPLVLVLGNEGRGLRPLVESQCDFNLTIPLQAGISLNVSTAAAVLLYQLGLPSPDGSPSD